MWRRAVLTKSTAITQQMSKLPKDGCDLKAMEMERLQPVMALSSAGCQPLSGMGKLGWMGAYRQEVIDRQLMNGNSLSPGNIIACNALSIQLINFLSE